MTRKVDHAAIAATLDTRTWASRKMLRLGRPVNAEEVAAYVASRHPDVKGEALGYVLTYADPNLARREWVS